MKPKSEKLECKLFASRTIKSLGINMNIVNNVGQMFMFVWVAFCSTFGDVFGCCRAKVLCIDL